VTWYCVHCGAAGELATACYRCGTVAKRSTPINRARVTAYFPATPPTPPEPAPEPTRPVEPAQPRHPVDPRRPRLLSRLLAALASRGEL